jgi:hypothetical protein
VSLSVGDNEYTFTLRTYWQSDNGNNSESWTIQRNL